MKGKLRNFIKCWPENYMTLKAKFQFQVAPHAFGPKCNRGSASSVRCTLSCKSVQLLVRVSVMLILWCCWQSNDKGFEVPDGDYDWEIACSLGSFKLNSPNQVISYWLMPYVKGNAQFIWIFGFILCCNDYYHNVTIFIMQ